MVEFRTPCWFLVLEALERSRCRGWQHHHYNLIFDIGTVQKGRLSLFCILFYFILSIHVACLSSLRKDECCYLMWHHQMEISLNHPAVNLLQRLEVNQHLLLQLESNSWAAIKKRWSKAVKDENISASFRLICLKINYFCKCKPGHPEEPLANELNFGLDAHYLMC